MFLFPFILTILVGYARVVLAIISFCMYEDPMIFFWCYLASFLLDAADGHVARMFNQCTYHIENVIDIYSN